jgi:adenylosuccinate synthase
VPLRGSSAAVVIGTAFGDEGKGLMTDALASEAGPQTTVVRFNGGAQAGHTVQTPDGRRHVFHQFGSGAFAGARTHLSRFFIANPILFLREREALRQLGAHTEVTISEEALISTPWDMFANTEAETWRGTSRHGSCGIGIGETVARNEQTPFRLTMGDLASPGFVDRLKAIRDRWLPARFQHLKVEPDKQRLATIRSDDLFQQFVADAGSFRSSVAIQEVAEALRGRAALFEGAQGLLLDQNLGAPWFPHVTRSNTGLRNVVALASEAGIGGLDVYYMMRAYLTRHGAGPLPHEYENKPFAGIIDDTNVRNPWQQTLRFAPMNLDLLKQGVEADRMHRGELHVTTRLTVTCLDQVPDAIPVISRGRTCRFGKHEAIAAAAKSISAEAVWTSHGPTRQDLARAATPRLSTAA